jgi:hypothetical protein
MMPALGKWLHRGGPGSGAELAVTYYSSENYAGIQRGWAKTD